jgi:hypothetical protein
MVDFEIISSPDKKSDSKILVLCADFVSNLGFFTPDFSFFKAAN